MKNADKRVGNDVKIVGSAKYSIVTLSNGIKYVQAEKQVTSGNDPKLWEQQIIDYVNQNVRNGKDVIIPLDNGDKIKITGRTAWKLGYRNNSRYGTPVNEKIYMVKGNASGVIDEIIQTSRYSGWKEDKTYHKFATKGFEYRKAYFKDLDGVYYELKISVGINEEGKEAYNIGDIKKMQPLLGTNTVTGSKASATASHNSVAQKNDNVNTLGQKNSKEYSDGDLNVTIEDIQAVQSVGRKSINDFTSEDIKKTESFARKYFKEMGVKSPFFRAWFGDWRANDNTKVKWLYNKCWGIEN